MYIGDGVTTIGDWAFSGCSSLDHFAFGSSVETIGKEAFSDCVSVTKIISQAATPPTCGTQALDDISKWDCVLEVPAASVDAYRAADQWKDFFFVQGGADAYKPVAGDANGDGEVTVTDIVLMVNYIMGFSTEIYFEAADVNGDGEANVTDIVRVVALIMNAGGDGARMKASESLTDNDCLTLTRSGEQQLQLRLKNEGRYVAAQFDLVLTDGQTLEDIALNSNRGGRHQLTYTQTDEGCYKVLVFATDNRPFAGNEGELLNFSVTGEGNVVVKNILFVTDNLNEKQFPALGTSTTGISDINKEALPVDIYGIDGRLVRQQSTGNHGLKKGLYIVNGKKHMVR